MLCPECGAEITSSFDICPLCNKSIDRQKIYSNYLFKGDSYFNSGEIEKAIISYKKALEYLETEEVYFKLGNSHFKKGEKASASYYLKALSLNFYNEKVHNMLITLYDKFNKLDELKVWYEKNKQNYKNEFIEKYIKIIENMKTFKENNIKIGTEKENIFLSFFKSMKTYFLLNITILIIFLLLGMGLIFAFFMQIKFTYFLLLTSIFFIVSLVFIFISRLKSIKKEDKEKINLEDILKDIKDNKI